METVKTKEGDIVDLKVFGNELRLQVTQTDSAELVAYLTRSEAIELIEKLAKVAERLKENLVD